MWFKEIILGCLILLKVMLNSANGTKIWRDRLQLTGDSLDRILEDLVQLNLCSLLHLQHYLRLFNFSVLNGDKGFVGWHIV